MKKLKHIIVLQFFLFILINMNTISQLNSNTYLVDGIKLNVNDNVMKLLSDNVYWIHTVNRSIDGQYKVRYDEEGKEIFYYWEDDFNSYEDKQFYCGKDSPDVLCIKSISKYLKQCDFNVSGDVFWKESSGVYIEWSDSFDALQKKLKSCNVELTSELKKIDTFSRNLNLLIISFVFICIMTLPFILIKREKSNDIT